MMPRILLTFDYQLLIIMHFQQQLSIASHKYRLTYSVNLQNLIFTLHDSLSSKAYYTQLTQEQLPSKCFPFFDSIQQVEQYLKQFPEKMIYDEIQFAVKLEVQFRGEIGAIWVDFWWKDVEELVESKFREMERENMHLKVAKKDQQKQIETKIMELQLQIQQTKITKQHSYSQNNRMLLQIDLITHQIQIIHKSILKIQESLKQLKLPQKYLQEMDIFNDKYSQGRSTNCYLHELEEIGDYCLKVKQFFLEMKEDFKILTKVELRGCQLRGMAWVQIFSCLRELDLSNNRIIKVEGVSDLKLQYLNLSYNNISYIPQTLPSSLTHLILHHNEIQNFSNLDTLSNITVLSLSNNKLTKIPKMISYLTSLVELRLLNNEIKSISLQIMNLKYLKRVSLWGNPVWSCQSRFLKIMEELAAKMIQTSCGDF